jgi:hypothetical protein
MKIRVTDDEKTIISRYAHEQYTEMSSIIRSKVNAYGKKGLKGIALPKVLSSVSASRRNRQLSFVIPPEQWDLALERSRADGVPLATIIRSSLLEDAR